jgi:Calcineurin-like phosphoesterase
LTTKKKTPAKKTSAKTKKVVAKKTPAKTVVKPAQAVGKAAPLRYAQPFYTATPVGQRPETPFGRRMEDFAFQNLGPIPPLKRTPAVMTLADVIGQAASDAFAAAGVIRFHAVGDTGRSGGSTAEEAVAELMSADYKVGQSTSNPAFFFHLGDVVYGPNKDAGYRDAFYRPYMEYPGKIIAIPGNHDGETYPVTDPVSLEAFQANFCLPTATVPPMAKGIGILRQMVPQPGVYWWLQHELFDLIALYSNCGEGQGNLADGKGNQVQLTFLLTSLKSILATRVQSKKTKPLLIATHHPAFSDGGHTGSAHMLEQIDTACQQAGIVPHLVLAGHAHNYQRFTRTNTITAKPATTTFLVAGTGGFGLQTVAAATRASHPTANSRAAANPPTFDKSLMAYGYMLLTIGGGKIVAEFWQVPPGTVRPFDSVSIPIQQ